MTDSDDSPKSASPDHRAYRSEIAIRDLAESASDIGGFFDAHRRAERTLGRSDAEARIAATRETMERFGY